MHACGQNEMADHLMTSDAISQSERGCWDRFLSLFFFCKEEHVDARHCVSIDSFMVAGPAETEMTAISRRGCAVCRDRPLIDG